MKFNIDNSEITDIDSIYKLYEIRTKINVLIKKYELESNFNEISFEELKINILFHYLKSENFSKILKTAPYLNKYLTYKFSQEIKKHISKKFLQNNIIEILYGHNSNNDLMREIHGFVEFIAPSINFELLCQMFEFKEKANQAKIVEIDHSLKFFMKYMESNVI
jgi:hypothetical protein